MSLTLEDAAAEAELEVALREAFDEADELALLDFELAEAEADVADPEAALAEALDLDAADAFDDAALDDEFFGVDFADDGLAESVDVAEAEVDFASLPELLWADLLAFVADAFDELLSAVPDELLIEEDAETFPPCACVACATSLCGVAELAGGMTASDTPAAQARAAQVHTVAIVRARCGLCRRVDGLSPRRLHQARRAPDLMGAST